MSAPLPKNIEPLVCFQCRMPSLDLTWEDWEAPSPSEAAETFAGECEEDCRPSFDRNGGSEFVEVKHSDGNVQTFRVHVRLKKTYHADEVPPKEETGFRVRVTL
jgi:hypothetical protein